MSSPRRKPSAIAERALDPDRCVALSNLPRRFQPAIAALWDIDLALADAVATSTEPALGAIRLAWWREQLEELDRGGVPGGASAEAVAEHLLPPG